MAPEKINPHSTGYSVKSDIWSLGITLIEIATARHPYAQLTFFPLIVTILDEPVPKLPTESFTTEFCSFVDSWYVFPFFKTKYSGFYLFICFEFNKGS